MIKTLNDYIVPNDGDCGGCPFLRYGSYCSNGDNWHCVIDNNYVPYEPTLDKRYKKCELLGKKVRITIEQLNSSPKGE